MKTLLFYLIVILLGLFLLIGVGTGIGFMLHWLLPQVDLGIGVLIGVVALAFIMQMITRLLMSLPVVETEEGEAAREEKPSEVLYLMGEMSGRRRRKRRSNR